MPNLNLTPLNLLGSEALPSLLENRKLLEKMAGLVEDRRLRMVEQINIIESGCWIWEGATSDRGYGKIVGNGRGWRVHRLIWMLVNGFVSQSVKICHTCDTPPCANPEHLFAGTQQDNLNDMRAKGRHVRGEKMPHSVLTEDDVRNMRRRKASGEHWKSIWADFPIGWRAFFRVIKGERWAHVK